jgi:hypothetical protein
MNSLTRRQFLKLAGSVMGAAAAMPFADVAHVLAREAEPELLPAPPASLGRVITWGVQIRARPRLDSRLIRVTSPDEILPLHEQVLGEAVMPHNPIWYKTDNGLVHSAWVQPVENILNPALWGMAAFRFWGEITVPFSDSRLVPDPRAGVFFRLYYTSVYRVVAAVWGEDEQWWYRLQDGITWGPGPYVPATHVRRIDPAQLTPISPHVANKRVEVDLSRQLIVAYENDQPVMVSRVASGFGDNRTPAGRHVVLAKCLASRMTGGVEDDFYDLPGVPFPTFFTSSMAGIHGTYWHNDFGRPRSHGCLNVPSLVARWFWRWTTPVAPYDEAMYKTPRNATATLINIA